MFGIDPNWFVQIITAYDLDDPTHAKPQPYSVLKILVTQHKDSKNAIMVGDARNFVLMAKSANIEPVVVLTGQLNHKQAKVLGVTHLINNVTQLEQILAIATQLQDGY